MKGVPNGLQAVVAGDGPFAAPMKKCADELGVSKDVTFLGQVPHDQVAPLHRACDIYLSLNPMGNLTNANLEAMRCGACMIIPKGQGKRGIDADTDKLVPESAVLRIARHDDVAGLAQALHKLHANQVERKELSSRMAALASDILPNWNERVQHEITLLEELVDAGAATRHKN